MSNILKHQNVKVMVEKASSNHETHFLQVNDQLELKTSDDDLLSQLQTIDGNIVDVETILNSQTTELQAIKDNTHNIKASIELGGDLYVSQDDVEAKLDTLINHNDGIETLLTSLDTAQDLSNTKLDTLNSQTVNNVGIYQAQVHIRDINLPQLHSDIHAFKNANHTDLNTLETKTDLTNTKLDTLINHNDGIETLLTSLDTAQDLSNTKLDTLNSQTVNNVGIYQAQVHIRDINLPQLHSDIHAFKNANHTDLVTLETKIDLTNTKLDILETSNQLIKNNGIRAWGATQTIEGNLIVLAGATHSGSSSFTTIPTKPIIIYVKSHNAITDWFGVIEGSIDNSIWMPIPVADIPIINLQGLGGRPQQQAAVYVNNPPFPYLRVIITNANAANRGFEIKIIQTS